MKSLVTGAILAALLAAPAAAQVYGADDDPYAQNPFASNMTLPDTSDTSSSTSAPAQAVQQQDVKQVQPQQQTAASGNSQTAKPKQP